MLLECLSKTLTTLEHDVAHTDRFGVSESKKDFVRETPSQPVIVDGLVQSIANS